MYQYLECMLRAMLNTGAMTLKNAYFGQGTGPIQLNNVRCTGNEVLLLQCSHSTLAYSCGHDKDAGLRCYGETY